MAQTVIVDYGHNPSALSALIDAIEQFPHTHRTAVYTAAGDRRDCDMVRQGELLASISTASFCTKIITSAAATKARSWRIIRQELMAAIGLPKCSRSSDQSR